MLNTNRKAYITFLSSDNYFYYVLALFDSLSKTNSKYKLYCCVTDGVSNSTLSMMDKIGLDYIHVSISDFENIINQSTKNKAPKKYIGALGKLSIFNLVEFSKCVYLDSDLIIKKNIDDLFDRPAFSAVEDCLPVHKRPSNYILGESSFNSGMFVFEPSKEYYKKILDTIPTLDPNIKWHDQAILSYLNQDWMQRPELQLPYTYNTLVAQQEDVLGEIRRLNLSLDDVKVYHYVTYKDAPYTLPKTLFDNVYSEYYNYFSLINDLIDSYGLDLVKINLTNVLCKNKMGKHCVDLVVPYVDSSDKNWIELFNKYSPKLNIEAIDAANRFRGNEELFKYFFRCIENNMPWINTIHLLVQSDSQVPKWINRDKVHIVYHEDFIPKKFLPTFNSCTIEMFLWNIPGLKEQFLYANDDFYALAPTMISDWFSGDKVKFNFTLCTGQADNLYIQHTINVRNVIDGKEYETGFVLNHNFRPYFKSRLVECYRKYRGEIEARITQFRSSKNVNCYLFNYYDYINNKMLHNDIPYRYCSLNNSLLCISAITSGQYKTIVINDNYTNEVNEVEYNKIISAFRDKIPKMSNYEIINITDIPDAYITKVNNIVSKVPEGMRDNFRTMLLSKYNKS